MEKKDEPPKDTQQYAKVNWGASFKDLDPVPLEEQTSISKSNIWATVAGVGCICAMITLVAIFEGIGSGC